MSLQSFLTAAKLAATDADKFLIKVWHAVEGTEAAKELETVAVETLAVPIEAAVASLLPVPFSTAVDALIQQLAKQIEAEISAQQVPAPTIQTSKP